MSAELKLAVRKALAGNLVIDNNGDGLRLEDAMMYIAAAQLKAVAIALATQSLPNSDPGGWDMDECFTVDQAIAAINGTASVLANARALIAESREAELKDEAEAAE